MWIFAIVFTFAAIVCGGSIAFDIYKEKHNE